MADSTADRLAEALADLGRRETAALALVSMMVVGSHVVAPIAIPGEAVYARYATYLVVFSVWMAWFVDWLAVRLGRDPHPSERGEETTPASTEGADDDGR